MKRSVCLLALVSASAPVFAADWSNTTNTNNDWHIVDNWTVADFASTANFNLAQTYDVAFGADALTGTLAVSSGDVRFLLGGKESFRGVSSRWARKCWQADS